jgi:ADP-ribose pyrophosphatase
MKKKIKLTKKIYLINKKFKKKEFYQFLSEPNNSVIVPFYKKKFLIVEQKREAINKKNYEFPMGWIDNNDSPLETAIRELKEETGFMSLMTPKMLINFYPDPGRNDRACYCFYTNRLKKIGNPEKGIKIFFKSKKQIEKLIFEKKFNSSIHIAAFYSFINLT